ncbi:MAG: hypothetical protein V1725_02690 [archaeon]
MQTAPQGYTDFRTTVDRQFSHDRDHLYLSEKERAELDAWWASVFPHANADVIQKRTIFKRNIQKGIEIFHFLRPEVKLDDILAEGLKTRDQLVKEGKIAPREGSYRAGPFRDDVVYFTYPRNDRQLANLYAEPWVSILVSPAAFVHNAEARISHLRRDRFQEEDELERRQQRTYAETMLTLSDFVQRSKLSDPHKGHPGRLSGLHPFTAYPCGLWLDSDHHLMNVGYCYNEIIIPRTVTPKEFFRTSRSLSN